MTPDDRPDFEKRLRELFAAVSQPLTEERLEGFWKGLVRMGVFEFGRAVDLLLAELAEGDPPKFLNARHIWAARDRGRARATPDVAAPRSVSEVLRALAESDPKNNSHLKGALALNEDAWGWLQERDADLARLERNIAICGVVLAREDPRSEIYRNAVADDQRFRQARMDLFYRRRQQTEAA